MQGIYILIEAACLIVGFAVIGFAIDYFNNKKRQKTV